MTNMPKTIAIKAIIGVVTLKPMFLDVIATQFVATIITVYGILLPAMGWGIAALVWGYALLLFVITDFAKVRLNKLLNHKGVALRSDEAHSKE